MKTLEQAKAELLLARQELLEEEMITNGVERYQRTIRKARRTVDDNGRALKPSESNTSYGIGILKFYVEAVAEQLEADTAYWKNRAGRKPIAWSYIGKLDPHVCAFIGIRTILDTISSETKLTSLVHRIAAKIEDQARIDIFKIQDKKYFQSTSRFLKELDTDNYRTRRALYTKAEKRRTDIIRKWTAWPVTDKLHIGTAILECFIKATSDYNDDGSRIQGSAMVEKYMQRIGKKTTYFVAGTTKAADWIKANTDVCQFFTPDFLPCIAPPMDWVSPTQGGFHTPELQSRRPMVKMQYEHGLRLMADRFEEMPKFVRTINYLQRVPWEINTFVHNQMKKEFASANGVGVPSQVPYTRPADPAFFMEQGNMPMAEFKIARRKDAKKWSEEQKAEYKLWLRDVRKFNAAENKRVTEVMALSRTMAIAERFSAEDCFYHVWWADFRGRLYASCTALSPQGTAHSKALLKFHRGVALGENGLFHLCIHAAGVWGNDKCSLNERVQWVLENKEAIIQTYNDPDSTRDFWKQADKPYMFLACCEELGQCLQLDTKGQREFISHIPCAQDGSCNGIQHYSAMLKDMIGAAAVNLLDSEVPGDIYTEVGNVVRDYMEYCRKNGLTFNGSEWVGMTKSDDQVLSGWEEFGIKRSCTKKPTMVIPYGGTKIGTRDDCKDYLASETEKAMETDTSYQNPFVNLITTDIDGKETDPEVHAITYLHHLVWQALDDVVVAAREAMKFLRTITQIVAKTGDTKALLQVTSATGFRMYQQIKATKAYEVESHLEGRICLKLRKEIDEVDKRKMQTSIAPNFVHELDSTHLQMTVTMAEDMGIYDMACIHDSDGAHAGNCDGLHTALRYAFYELHSVSQLKRFREEQIITHPELADELMAVELPKTGEYDIKNVLNSTHFFR